MVTQSPAEGDRQLLGNLNNVAKIEGLTHLRYRLKGQICQKRSAIMKDFDRFLDFRGMKPVSSRATAKELRASQQFFNPFKYPTQLLFGR